MKQHIISLPHHPKRVIIISLVVALALGIFGYIKINKKPNTAVTKNNFDVNADSANSPHNLTLGFLASGRIKDVSVKTGDVVKKGQVLATLDAGNMLGALQQAKAAYATAQANYQKVISGATGSTIDVAKSAVNTAKVNLAQVTNQQNTLVLNARRKLFSDGLVALPDRNTINVNPVISGNYDGLVEGDYTISFRNLSFTQISYGGLEGGITNFDTLPQPLGSKGLLISFPNGTSGLSPNDSWTIHVPNKSGVNYTTNLNAYQSAMSNKDQAIASAQAMLDQANAALTSVVTTARPEDVAAAQAQVSNASGMVQIAEANYENTVITAPADGVIVTVAIEPGQIATPNQPAIIFTTNVSAN